MRPLLALLVLLAPRLSVAAEADDDDDPPLKQPPSDRVQLRFLDGGERFTLHLAAERRLVRRVYGGVLWSEPASYRELCTAPCTVELSPGLHELALSVAGQE